MKKLIVLFFMQIFLFSQGNLWSLALDNEKALKIVKENLKIAKEMNNNINEFEKNEDLTSFEKLDQFLESLEYINNSIRTIELPTECGMFSFLLRRKTVIG